jgi:beta-lactamase regulating signal transducer with metallopeptidase domain
VKDLNGHAFAASLGDYLVLWLNRKFGAGVPLVLVTTVLAVGATLLLLRVVHAFRFERKRRQDRRFADQLGIRQVGRRSVDIYCSEAFSGTPFTGGWIAPYICIPRDAHEKLTDSELEAVIAHEIGHIRQFDLLFTIFIQSLGDLFWFIPGYLALSRKIDRLREIVADQWVVRSGQNPAVLASALLKLKEIPETTERFVLYSAFFREKSLLKIRIERLLSGETEGSGRFFWQKNWVRYVATFWITTSVIFVTIGGNHRALGPEDLEMIDKVMRFFGLA